MSFPTQTILQAGLQQLNAKWMGKNGVSRVVLQSDPSGKLPAYYFQGPSAQVPAGLPGCMVVPNQDNRPFKVPVFWRQEADIPQQQSVLSPRPEIFNSSGNARLPLDPLADQDIDRAYWFFATPPTLNRRVKNYLPAFHAIPEPTNMAPPAPEADNAQIHVDMRLPQYVNPNHWAKPFDPYACICCTWFARPTIIYNFIVPDTYMLILKGISYDISTDFPAGTVFQVDILRGGSVAASFEETVVDPLNPDPSKRCAFASHDQSTPLFVLVDRGESLMVQITMKGLYPFTKTDQETFCGTLCILLLGWLAPIMDNRDGAMRPSDVGDMREGVGNESYGDITEEYIEMLMEWIHATTGTK